MTEQRGSQGVLPERDQQTQPADHSPAQPTTTDLRGEETTKKLGTHGRPVLWLLGLVFLGAILVIAVALTGSDSGLGPTAGAEPLGSDRHLENQAARARLQLRRAYGSDRHLENQAARPHRTQPEPRAITDTLSIKPSQ